MNKIEKFVKENKLDFSGTGSDLNGNCVILAGYSLYLGFKFYIDVLDEFLPKEDRDGDLEDEFERVFDYAENNYYHHWWHKKKAHTMYKF